VSFYTAAADQLQLAEQAMAAAYGKEGEKLSNRKEGLDTSARNTLKRKDA
jgi:hypothetical protein